VVAADRGGFESMLADHGVSRCNVINLFCAQVTRRLRTRWLLQTWRILRRTALTIHVSFACGCCVCMLLIVLHVCVCVCVCVCACVCMLSVSDLKL